MTSRDYRQNYECSNREAELPPGQWLGGLVKRFVPDQPELEFAPAPSHCYCGALLIEGACDDCLTWAVKNARQWEWDQQRWANRHRVWQILDARKSVAA
ncbi:hypothetical protein AERO9AM_30611 [Aeromicrobium sp. 9AM]|nr:hypothetical protein AERO9AM_30611 [Aeromicrobium sp. 9AM]